MRSKGQRIIDVSSTTLAPISCRWGPTRLLFAFDHGRFPDGSRGVLYYHLDPTLPPISGSVRFRLCENPNAFHRGSDLLISPGRPWHIPLFTICRINIYRPLLEMLLDEGLVDRSVVTDVQAHEVAPRNAASALFALHQPLSLSLSLKNLHIWLVTRKTCHIFKFPLFYPFSDVKVGFVPFNGK